MGVGAERLPLAADHIEITVVGRAAKKIGDDKTGHPPGRQRPAAHIGQSHRAVAEVLGDHLVHGYKLHRAQPQPQQHQRQQPAGQPQREFGRALSPPQQRQPDGGVITANKQRVVGDFNVAGQRLHTQHCRAGKHIRDRRIAGAPFFFLLADDNFDEGQQQRQPGRSGNDHRKNHADHKKRAERIGQPGRQRRPSTQPQHPHKNVHV